MNSVSALRSFSVALSNGDVYTILSIPRSIPLLAQITSTSPSHIVWMTERLLYCCLMATCDVFRSK